jgi:hypothetical protein
VISYGRKNKMFGLFERQHGFIYQFLLGFYIKNMFKQRTKVFHDKIRYLCETLSSHLGKQHTLMKYPISLKNRVAMSLMRLGNGKDLQLVGDLFEIAKGTISMIV